VYDGGVERKRINPDPWRRSLCVREVTSWRMGSSRRLNYDHQKASGLIGRGDQTHHLHGVSCYAVA